jgi:hypothetical protein
MNPACHRQIEAGRILGDNVDEVRHGAPPIGASATARQ